MPEPTVATFDFVPRISSVAVAGFHGSPVFTWERLNHGNHPRSTAQSYKHHFSKAMKCSEHVVVVAWGNAVAHEDGKTTATIVREGTTEARAKTMPWWLVLQAGTFWQARRFAQSSCTSAMEPRGRW